LLKSVGVDAWKIPSGEVSTGPVFERMLQTGLPVILSSGMSSFAELDETVGRIKQSGVDLTVLQCSSIYPTPPEKLGLNLIADLKKRYACRTGLSDHSGTVYAGLAAVALGAEVLEVHVTLSREAFGPDVPASQTTAELKDLVCGVRFIRAALEHPVDKNRMAEELAPMRSLFNKSVAVLKDLSAGALLDESNIGLRKPGTGLPAAKLPALYGRKLRRPIPAGTLISEADLE
jgi:N-acetylneuraminate synthase